jgi:peptidoglycan/xylan/chitin deacetylase (PgdA/CDA1 family)
MKVDMLAWPFGIYDEDLIRKAVEAGYVSAFTIERFHAKPSDHVMALPRYLITDADQGKAFGRMLAGSPCL